MHRGYYLPLEAPFAGPNFFEFGDDVRYEIHIDNDGDDAPEIAYEFEFHTEVRNPDTFLYNTGPIDSIASPNWNRRQFYSVTRVKHGHRQTLATNLACPPCNIGPASTPSYASLAAEAVHRIPGGHAVFAGQRLEGFYVDLGAVFDLGDLRPLQNLHLAAMAIAGVTYPLVDKSYTPDAAASLVTDGLTASSTRYLSHFPYLGTPVSGYQTKPLEPPDSGHARNDHRRGRGRRCPPAGS